LNDYELVQYAALLHDIGKFYQRTGKSENNKYSKLTIEDFGYSGAHSKWSASFVDDMGLDPSISELILYHHYPSKLKGELKILGDILSEADHLSSSERKADSDKKDPMKEPLVSVFSRLKVSDSESETHYYYPLKKLDFNSIPYPEPFKEKTMGGWNLTPEYKLLWDGFIKKSQVISGRPSIERLLCLLEEYTTFIPSAAYVSLPDVSLFDHMKTTCAIASASYNYYKETGVHGGDGKWIFVGGNISGIQKFIYNLKSSKSTLKVLRGRSFYLEALVESIATKILEELNLSRSNLIYSGGGNFFIIAQNTPEAKRKIADIKKKVNSHLLDEFGSKIYVLINHLEISKEDFGKFSGVWRDLLRRLGEDKSRKFIDEINDERSVILGPHDDRPDVEKCSICGSGKGVEPDNEGIVSCGNCRNMITIGAMLPKSDGFFLGGSSGIRLIFDTNLGFMKENDNLGGRNYVYSINSFDFVESHEKVATCPIGNYYSFSEGEGIKTTENFSRESVGINRLGNLRLDVDNLGMIFSKGFGDESSLSRMSTLSRFLKYFFGSYINVIAKRDASIDKAPSLFKEQRERKVAVVYSGGDDAFIIGSWNDCIEIAFDINEAFKRYSCGRMSVSCGVTFSREKYPIYKSAKDSEIEETKAKRNGKDSISIFGTAVKWDTAIKLMELFGKPLLSLSTYNESENRFESSIPSGFLYRIDELRKKYKSKGHLIMTPFVYNLSRFREREKNRLGKEKLELFDQFSSNFITNTKYIEYINIPIYWIIYSMRKGGEYER